MFIVDATSIPESQLGNIPVPYFGRIINFAGDRTYDPWQVTIMNDEDFAVRNALEAWSDSINAKVRNVRDNVDYKSIAIVTQLSKTGQSLRTYRFNGIYPSRIDPIRLDWSDTNQFERFNVQFTYDYWDIYTGGTAFTGNAGGL